MFALETAGTGQHGGTNGVVAEPAADLVDGMIGLLSRRAAPRIRVDLVERELAAGLGREAADADAEQANTRARVDPVEQRLGGAGDHRTGVNGTGKRRGAGDRAEVVEP